MLLELCRPPFHLGQGRGIGDLCRRCRFEGVIATSVGVTVS